MKDVCIMMNLSTYIYSLHGMEIIHSWIEWKRNIISDVIDPTVVIRFMLLWAFWMWAFSFGSGLISMNEGWVIQYVTEFPSFVRRKLLHKRVVGHVLTIEERRGSGTADRSRNAELHTAAQSKQSLEFGKGEKGIYLSRKLSKQIIVIEIISFQHQQNWHSTHEQTKELASLLRNY